MGTNVGAAEIDVVPSVKGFKGKLERDLSPQLRTAGKKAGEGLGASMVSGVRKHLVGIGASIATAFAVKKVVTSSVNAFKDWTLGVIQMKRVAGGSVANVSRLRFSVQESGVDATKATAAFGIFSKKLAGTNGDAKKTAALNDQLGFSFRNAEGHIRPLTVLLPKLADKFAKMPDGPEKSALAMQLFGRSGRDLLPFLNKGAAGIAELSKESDRLGLTLNQHAIDKFSEYKKATREWDASLQGLKVSLGGQILPSLTRFNQFLSRNLGPGIEKVRLWIKTSPQAKQASREVGLGLADVAKWGRDDAAPAIEGFVKGMQAGTGAGGAFAGALHNVVGVGRGVVGIFKALPDPVTKTGIKVVLAAVALNRLQTAINGVKTSAFITSMRASATASETAGVAAGGAAGRFTSMGGVAKQAAGVGGILALTDASNRSSKSLGLLEGAAGGAAAGFAVGGPWGAAVGAAAGGLLGIFSSGKKAGKGINFAAQAAADAQAQTDDLASSLNQVTASYTRMTRRIVAEDLRKSGAFSAADDLGLSYRTLVNAALGYPRALSTVAAAQARAEKFLDPTKVDIYGTQLQGLSAKQIDAANSARQLGNSIPAIGRNSAEARKQILLDSIASNEFAKSLRGVPDKKILQIGTEGTDKARADIVKVATAQHLTDKQIKILLSVANLPATLVDIAAVRNSAKSLAAQQYQLRFKAILSTNATVADGLPHRAAGGPVRKGQPYVVGERRAELFVPNQDGRIQSRVPASVGAGGSGAPGGSGNLSVNFSIGDIEFETYINAIIDDRMNP